MMIEKNFENFFSFLHNNRLQQPVNLKKSSGYFTSGDKIAQMTITYIALPVTTIVLQYRNLL